MKKTSIILIISLIICLFCVISISVAPVINNLLDNFTTWGKLNCELYSEIAEYSSQKKIKLIAIKKELKVQKKKLIDIKN